MTLRSLLCLDYGSGICMRRAPRMIVFSFREYTVQRAHALNDHIATCFITWTKG